MVQVVPTTIQTANGDALGVGPALGDGSRNRADQARRSIEIAPSEVVAQRIHDRCRIDEEAPCIRQRRWCRVAHRARQEDGQGRCPPADHVCRHRRDDDHRVDHGAAGRTMAGPARLERPLAAADRDPDCESERARGDNTTRHGAGTHRGDAADNGRERRSAEAQVRKGSCPARGDPNGAGEPGLIARGCRIAALASLARDAPSSSTRPPGRP